MGELSSIEWTDHTFNPWVGCTKVGPGCDNCYAERLMDHRLGRVAWGGTPIKTSYANWRKVRTWHKKLRRGQRQRVFCASLADVFDNKAPDHWRAELVALIEETPKLDWLLVTKRIGNAVEMMREARARADFRGDDIDRWPDNVWLGITVVNQDEADRDIPKLLQVPARVRFLSMEPLLAPVDLRGLFQRCPVHDFDGGFCVQDCGNWQRLDWVIIGGESGPNARPMNPAWPRQIRDQCAAGGVPFFFKQWGEWGPDDGPLHDGSDPIMEGRGPVAWHDGQAWRFAENGFTAPLSGGGEWVYRLGKKRTGRELDGTTHSAFPVTA